MLEAPKAAQTEATGVRAARGRGTTARYRHRLGEAMRALFVRSPLHPQWLVLRHETRRLRDAARLARGRVLDVGCADGRLAAYLSEDCDYTGLDYPATSDELYGTRPMVYGDAAALPFADGSFDTVLLLEVLEHVRHPDAALAECRRVLAEGGQLLLSMPFLYPLHDAPADYQRYTVHGLRARLAIDGMRIVEEKPLGHPLTTAALLSCIALARTGLDAWERRSPGVLLVAALPAAVLLLNLLGWLAGAFGSSGHFMAHGHSLRALRDETSGRGEGA